MIQDFLSSNVTELIKQWKYYFSLLAPQEGDLCLDIGCNTADSLILMVKSHPEINKAIGIEKKNDFCETARSKIKSLNLTDKIEIINHDVGTLEFEDNTFDKIICAETLEWMKDPKNSLKEIRRVLKNNGLALITHADFDTQVFNIKDKHIERTIVHAFCDFGPDGQIGRKLHKFCCDAKFSKIIPYVYTIINTEFTKTAYSHKVIDLMITWMSKYKTIDPQKLDDWFNQIKQSSLDGSFFYSINKYICLCSK